MAPNDPEHITAPMFNATTQNKPQMEHINYNVVSPARITPKLSIDTRPPNSSIFIYAAK